ncbi:MAG: FlgD immunoglobulin-like domain containing protein, partial [Bacteroidales bacterium]
NPFSETTKFSFTHNQAGNELDVVINIYRLDGSIVKTLNTKINPEGYQSDPLEWDGKADGGGQLNNGFYVYRMVIRNQDGQTGEDNSKLIYVK